MSISASIKLQTQKVPELRFPGFSDAWQEKKLGDVANVIMGQSPDSKFYNTNGVGKFLIQGNADINKRETKPRNWTTKPTKECQIGDIIMTVRAPVGYIAKSSVNACIGRGVCAIKNKKESSAGFLYQLLLNFEKRWIKFEQGSTFTAVNTKDVKNLKLLIPFLSEQNKIAGFLGAVDEWIENLRKQKDQLEQYKKGMMQKIFSQEIRFKDANGKPFPKWEEGKVSEILKSISTRNHQIKSSEIMDLGKYKVLDQGKELVAGYSNEASKILHKSPVIIFGDHTGALKYINFDFIVGADGTKVLSLKQEDNNLLFVYYTIQANPLKTEGYKRHYSILKNKKIKMPSLPEQNKIAGFLTSVDDLIESKQKQITQAEAWKRGLMQGLFV